MIILNGIVGEDITLIGVMSEFKKEKGKNVDIELTSNGGCAEEGYRIYSFIKNSDKNVRIEAKEHCYSAASLILMGAKERIISCPVMIHQPFFPPDTVGGTVEDIKEYGEYLEDITDLYASIYASESGNPKNEIRELMKRETYLNPFEAVSLGIGTKIGDKNRLITNKAVAFIKNFEKMRNEKKSVKDFLAMAAEEIEKIVKAEVLEYQTEIDGIVLIVNSESGNATVGDEATPDGTHFIPSKNIMITVENGYITEIGEVSLNESYTTAEVEGFVKEAVAYVSKKVNEENVKPLKQKIEELEKNQISEDDAEIIAFVKENGGIEKIKDNIKGRVRAHNNPPANIKNDFDAFNKRVMSIADEQIKALNEKKARLSIK